MIDSGEGHGLTQPGPGHGSAMSWSPVTSLHWLDGAYLQCAGVRLPEPVTMDEYGTVS